MTPIELSGMAWTQTWQLTLLIATALVLMRVWGRNRPHFTYVLWLVVILKCLTPPLWTSPGGVFCWLQPHTESTPPFNLAFIAREASSPTILDAARGDLAREDAATQPLPTGPIRPSPSPMKVTELREINTNPTLSVWTILVVVWLGGGVLLLVLSAVRWWYCWRTIITSSAESRKDLETALESLRERLGVRTTVRLIVTGSRIGPAVVGVCRPVILLPDCIVQGKSPRELEPVLAHELIHVRRGDLWVGIGQTLAQSLWWFHPLVWIANRLLSRDAERCCDEEVIAELDCQPARYARSLLEILELKRTLLPVPVFPGVRPVEVTSQRLERIMKLGHGCHKRTPGWCWLVLVLAAFITLPGAAFVGAGDESTKPSRRPSEVGQPEILRAPSEWVVKEPTSVRIYPVRDVLMRIQNDSQLSESDAKQKLEQFLSAEWRIDPRPQFNWSGRKLVVQHTTAGHDRVAKAVQFVRDNGIVNVMIEVYVVSGPPDSIDSLHARWELLDLPIPAEEVARDGNGFDVAQVLFADNRPPDLALRQASVAESIEKRSPALCAVVDPAGAAAILDQVRANPKKLMTVVAPKITTYAGQSASIHSVSHRPFVVGFKYPAGESPQPQVRVITSGLEMQLLPFSMPGEQVKLICQLELSNIRDVEKKEVTLHPGDKTLVVQVPEVVTTRIQLSYDFPMGQTLLIGGLRNTTDEGKSQSTLVMVRCAKFDKAPNAQPAMAAPIGHAGPVMTPPWAILPRPADTSSAKKPYRGVETNSDLIVKKYNVADLVIPIPNSVTLAVDVVNSNPKNMEPRVDSPTPVVADFDSLIDLIQSTIQPDSWEDVGGSGGIESFATDFSLVIRQREEVHQRIADLLGQLRTLQNVQVGLEIRMVGLPAEFAPEKAGDSDLIERTISPRPYGSHEPAGRATPQFLDAVRSHPQAKKLNLPKIALFNGQTLDVQIGSTEPNSVVRLRPVVSPDGRHVNIGSSVGIPTPNASDSPDLPAGTTVAGGDTLVFDLPATFQLDASAWSTDQDVPLLSKLPHIGRLFRNVNNVPALRTYLMVTPMIILQESQD